MTWIRTDISTKKRPAFARPLLSSDQDRDQRNHILALRAGRLKV